LSAVAPALNWLAALAAREGLRYEPDGDERWLRAWEPFITVRVPLRYQHVLQSTGEMGSITLARMVMDVHPAGAIPFEASAWIAIVQDVRLDATAAATCDTGSAFAEAFDLVSVPRMTTGDVAFDRVFASFAKSPDELAQALTPSLRKLVMGWRTRLHFEVRKGGFILVPVSLPPDAQGLGWLLRSVHLFGEKANKRPAPG